MRSGAIESARRSLTLDRSMRIINPTSGNLSNMLQIRGELPAQPGHSSQLELVVCAVPERLLQRSYVEGQEIPVSTTVTDIL